MLPIEKQQNSVFWNNNVEYLILYGRAYKIIYCVLPLHVTINQWKLNCQIQIKTSLQQSVKVSRKEPKCRMRETNIYWSTSSGGGCTGGEQSWNYSKQRERTKPPEVDSLESSPSRYRWKIIHTRLGCQTAWGNQQAGSLRLVEQDWREHTVQTHNKTARKTTQQH